MKKVVVIISVALLLASSIQYGLGQYEARIVERESNRCEQEIGDALESVVKSIEYEQIFDDNAVDIARADKDLLTTLGTDETELAYSGQKVSYLKMNPVGTKVGFYYGNEVNTGNYGDMALGIMDLETREIKTVYEGGFRTSNWSWLDNNRVEVRYGCGTYCMYAYKINVHDGEVESEYFIYP